MRKYCFGLLSLAACSSNAHERSETREPLQADDASSVEEELEPERAIEAVDLPYALEGLVCEGRSCRPIEILTNYSAQTLREREQNLPLEEFSADQIERSEYARRYALATLQVASELIDGGNPEALLDVALYLPEQFFDFGRLRGASDELRAELWNERTQQLQPSQSAVQTMIESLGGTFASGIQLANIVYAKVPASAVDAIVHSDSILGAAILPHDEPAADGIARRLAVAWNADGLQWWGWDGNQGGSPNGGPVRFAVVEAPDSIPNLLNANHLSFRENSVGGSRSNVARSCSPTCVNGFTGSNAASHGTLVASILLGDYEDGQSTTFTPPNPDPLPTLTARQQRGGAAPEGELYYYLNAASNVSGTVAGINEAVSTGVDIINMSSESDVSEAHCSNESYGGVMEAVRAAENAGVLVVAAAGNQHDDLGFDECSVSIYGTYPDTVTVGALTDVADLNSLATVSANVESGRSLLNNQITVGNGDKLWHRMVDIAVTGEATLVAGSNTTGTVAASGTSVAVPQVAGAAGILKDWLYSSDIDYIRHDPYALRAMLVASGDGAWPSAPNGTTVSVAPAVGFGNMRMTVPEFFGAGGYYKPLPHTLQTNSIFEIPVGPDAAPESTSIDGWKFVAVMDYDTYATSPSVTLQLIDKCPAGGGQTVLLTSNKTTHKARLRMTSSMMATHFHNRCLWVRGTVHYAGNTFSMWTFEYGYNGNRIHHDM